MFFQCLECCSMRVHRSVSVEGKTFMGVCRECLAPKEPFPGRNRLGELTGQKGRLLRHERIFQCESVVSPPQVSRMHSGG